MILAFLLVLACSAPDYCGLIKIAEMPPQECAVHGQMAAAEWAGEHPDLEIKGYRCVVVLTKEKDA